MTAAAPPHRPGPAFHSAPAGDLSNESLYTLPDPSEINSGTVSFSSLPPNPAFSSPQLQLYFPSLVLFRPSYSSVRPFSQSFVYPPPHPHPPPPLQLRIQAMQESCLFKSGLSGIAGGGLGLLFGLFFGGYANAVDKAVDMQGSTLVKLRVGAREAWIAMKSYSKNFARFGFVFSLSECALERIRATNDIVNATAAGGFTGAVMAAAPFQALPLQARLAQMAFGCASLSVFSFAIEYYMKYMD